MKKNEDYNVTSSGFRYKLDEDVLDDWETLTLLENIDSGELNGITKAVPKLLGKKQFENLKSFLRKKEGKVKITSVMREIGEILANPKLKN